MELGAFSVSLSVSDLGVSKAFYEKLGFVETGGDGEGYLIMVNGAAIIGLFQGMFEGNILTFNPGLGQDKELLSELYGCTRHSQSAFGVRHRDGYRYGPGWDRSCAYSAAGSGRQRHSDRSVFPQAGERILNSVPHNLSF